MLSRKASRLDLIFTGMCLCSKVKPLKIASEIKKQDLGFKFHYYLEPNTPLTFKNELFDTAKTITNNITTLGQMKNFLKSSKLLLSGFNFDYVLYIEDDAEPLDGFWNNITENLTVLKNAARLNKYSLPILDCYIDCRQRPICKTLREGWNKINPNFKKTGTIGMLIPMIFLRKFIEFIEGYIFLNPNKYQLDNAMFFFANSIGWNYMLHYPSLINHCDIRNKEISRGTI